LAVAALVAGMLFLLGQVPAEESVHAHHQSHDHSLAHEKHSPFDGGKNLSRPHCDFKHVHSTGPCPHLFLKVRDLQNNFLLGPDCGGLPADRAAAQIGADQTPSLCESLSSLDPTGGFVLLAGLDSGDTLLQYEPGKPPPQALF
jgi:hypothetical protein